MTIISLLARCGDHQVVGSNTYKHFRGATSYKGDSDKVCAKRGCSQHNLKRRRFVELAAKLPGNFVEKVEVTGANKLPSISSPGQLR